MHDEVGIVISPTEGVPEIQRGESGIGEGIHQEKPPGIDCIRARFAEHSKRVERPRAIGSDLNARANLAELMRFLKHMDRVALARERERSCKTSQPTSNHQERDALRLMHNSASIPRPFRRVPRLFLSGDETGSELTAVLCSKAI